MSQHAIIPLTEIAVNAVRRDNVVMARLLALCPMLAVSVSAKAAMTLGALTMIIMVLSGGLTASLRHIIPEGARLPIFLLLIAMLVATVDILMAAYFPAAHRQLGIFLPLIITNCAVLARLEVFARRQTPLAAVVDGAATGMGMLMAITILGIAREWLATGGIAPWITGAPILSSAALPVGGFMLFGLMIAVARKLKITP